MAEKFKIIRENNNVESVMKALTDTKDLIKDIFCAVRFQDGSLMIFDAGVPFESLCTISKKLDLIIDYRQQDEEVEDEEFDEEGL